MAGDLRYTDFCIPYELIYSVDEPRLDFPEQHMLCRYILKNLPEIVVEKEEVGCYTLGEIQILSIILILNGRYSEVGR